MSVVTVWTCPAGSTAVRTVTLASDQYGTCASGQGTWQSVLVEEPFDPLTLNSAQLSGAFAAGFSVMATGLVVVWGAKTIVRAVRTAL